jgi:hypothetical protein
LIISPRSSAGPTHALWSLIDPKNEQSRNDSYAVGVICFLTGIVLTCAALFVVARWIDRGDAKFISSRDKRSVGSSRTTKDSERS